MVFEHQTPPNDCAGRTRAARRHQNPSRLPVFLPAASSSFDVGPLAAHGEEGQVDGVQALG
jgi:hypothetical protein